MCRCNFNKDEGKDIDLSYNDYITEIENTFNFESIGKEYDVKFVDNLHFYSIPKNEWKFRVIKLYKYEPQPGESPIQKNTRKFCSSLYYRTQSENNYLTYEEVQSLSNPGRKYGVRDVLFYCGNYTTDRAYVNCRHRWIRFLYDTKTGNIVRDIKQPRYVGR